ncbi:MAG: hypothetical protein U9O98_00390 [Asgard group archaeon]|nr:hypothetical protein [Asgard group archaeon]
MIRKVVITQRETPLIVRNYEPGASDRGNLEGFQSTINTIFEKTEPDEISEEIINNEKVSYKRGEEVLFIVTSDPNELGVKEIFLKELERLFFAVFPEEFVNTWQGDDTSVFAGFEGKLDQLRSAFENRIMTKPGSRRSFDTLTVMELPQRLQDTALTILDSKILSFEEIINKTDLTPQQAVSEIQEILNNGFLYTTKMGNKVYYSVNSFQSISATGESTGQTSAEVSAPTTKALSEETMAKATAKVKETAPGVVAEKRDIDKGNMPFLIKQIRRDLDKVFNAILSKKTLLLIIDPKTDKNQVLLNMILDTLQCLAPDHELRIVPHAKDFIHPRDADIIRIERDLLRFYSNEIILDMDNKKVINGESSSYLNSIIQQMSKMKHSECVSLLLNRVSLIEKLAKDWAKIKELDLPSTDFLNSVRAKHGQGMVEIMDKVAKNVFMSE